jgi:CO/xanthine dehydrogenase Mo-binding subunit
MVAGKLGKPVEALRELNMYKEGDKTHFGQALQDWNVPTLWQQIKQSSDYERRRKEVDAFNSQNRWKKRGLAMMPTKFGISFTALMLNVSIRSFPSFRSQADPIVLPFSKLTLWSTCISTTDPSVYGTEVSRWLVDSFVHAKYSR